mmetsp:Transcript_18437/g.31535  ORF Transcript_18437/g.31535 Transcript_18437/m.31535 type:complete len:115 (-) Transcript_18437:492-836(-)
MRTLERGVPLPPKPKKIFLIQEPSSKTIQNSGMMSQNSNNLSLGKQNKSQLNISSSMHHKKNVQFEQNSNNRGKINSMLSINDGVSSAKNQLSMKSPMKDEADSKLFSHSAKQV